MAGESSPDIMFCKKRQNVVQTPLDGCIWTRLGVLVLMNREVQKKGGKTQKLGWPGYFRMRVNAQTKHLVGGGGLGGNKGS